MSVHTQCAWAWYWLSGRTYTIHIYMDTSVHEEIEISTIVQVLHVLLLILKVVDSCMYSHVVQA